jgi:hypothetical protein
MNTIAMKRRTIHVVLKSSDDNPEGWVWEGTFRSLTDAANALEGLQAGGYNVTVVSKNIVEDTGTITAVRSVSGQAI